MRIRRPFFPPLLVAALVAIGGMPVAQGQTGARALIQTSGIPLRPGVVQGGSQVPLERAQGGDTPVLTFRSRQGAVRLLLDTGAATTMVTEALVKRLGLTRLALAPQEFSMAGGGGDCPTLRLFRTQIPVLELPGVAGRSGLRLEGSEALVIPGAALPPGVDGLLGASALRQLPVLVDPVAEIVAMGPPALEWRQTLPASPRNVPLTWRRSVPLLPLRIRPGAGGPAESVPALADTGAEGVFLTPALARRLTPRQASQSARLVGVCGVQDVRRQPLFGVAIGEAAHPQESVEAILLANPVFSLLGVEAIVGQALLGRHRQLWRLEADPPRLELW